MATSAPGISETKSGEEGKKDKITLDFTFFNPDSIITDIIEVTSDDKGGKVRTNKGPKDERLREVCVENDIVLMAQTFRKNAKASSEKPDYVQSRNLICRSDYSYSDNYERLDVSWIANSGVTIFYKKNIEGIKVENLDLKFETAFFDYTSIMLTANLANGISAKVVCICFYRQQANDIGDVETFRTKLKELIEKAREQNEAENIRAVHLVLAGTPNVHLNEYSKISELVQETLGCSKFGLGFTEKNRNDYKVGTCKIYGTEKSKWNCIDFAGLSTGQAGGYTISTTRPVTHNIMPEQKNGHLALRFRITIKTNESQKKDSDNLPEDMDNLNLVGKNDIRKEQAPTEKVPTEQEGGDLSQPIGDLTLGDGVGKNDIKSEEN